MPKPYSSNRLKRRAPVLLRTLHPHGLHRTYAGMVIRNGSAVVASLGLLWLSAGFVSASEGPAPDSDFRRAYDLIRQNLPEVKQSDIDRAALEGMTSRLGPRVALVRQDSPPETPVSSLTRSNLFDGGVLYLRVRCFDASLEQAIQSAWEHYSTSNQVVGLVLDLRYAGGEDYRAAASVAGLFIAKKQPLLDWGEGMQESSEGGKLANCPVIALMNRDTSGAAEAFAGALREAGRGLLLGMPTAGKAGAAKEFPLPDGSKLRLITQPIKLGNGSAIGAEGVVPDITIEVAQADEKAYYQDPYAVRGAERVSSPRGVTSTRTNLAARRPRYGEAELVRDKRQGFSPEASAGRQRVEPEEPQIQDPALIRALDLLKGLAVIRQTRS